MMKLTLTLTLLAGLASPSPAAGAPRLSIVASPAGKTPADRAVHARLGEAVALYALVKVGRGRRARYYTDAPAVRLRGRKVRARQLLPFARLGATAVSWSRVEPRPHHMETDPPNPGNPAYSNAILFGKRHGSWLGYDTIEYVERDLPGAAGPAITVRKVRPGNPKVNVNGGLGTMRYRVRVTLEGQQLASPGPRETMARGVSSRVMRVTFRSSDSLAGHLRGYFNVPNVFGSGGGSGGSHQAARYQGADCADVLIGAARAAGARVPYTSVSGLGAHTVAVTPKLLLNAKGVFTLDGIARVTLPFGRVLRSGDLMLIDYKGFNGSPRSWDHIAMIDKDTGTPGVFDPQDKVMHMGYLYGLIEAPAHTEGPAYVQFRRFKRKYQRQMKRRLRHQP